MDEHFTVISCFCKYNQQFWMPWEPEWHEHFIHFTYNLSRTAKPVNEVCGFQRSQAIAWEICLWGCFKNDYQFVISGAFAAESQIPWPHQALNELVFQEAGILHCWLLYSQAITFFSSMWYTSPKFQNEVCDSLLWITAFRNIQRLLNNDSETKLKVHICKKHSSALCKRLHQ